MELESLVQIFGGAGTTFYIMWLWLKSVQAEKKEIADKLEVEQQARFKELREMLPILSEASKGLQSVLNSNSDNSSVMIEFIKTHIDEKTIEITEKCKKK